MGPACPPLVLKPIIKDLFFRTEGCPVPLAAAFSRVLREFPSARHESPRSHPLGHFIRHELADEVRNQADRSYVVEGSGGRGPWAETPWVAVFEPSVTQSASSGYYVVYLFRNDGAGVYLVLGQATTEIRLRPATRRGGRPWPQVLEEVASGLRALVDSDDTKDLLRGPIDLGGRAALTRGYERGNILAKYYPTAELPSDAVLIEDLARFLRIYQMLVETNDRRNQDVEPEIEGLTAAEAQGWRWHRRAERNPRLAVAAKRIHGFTCQVCGFNFTRRYGEIGEGYIEAHHRTPFNELAARPGPTLLSARDDFIVACANCHRMLHRTRPPLTPEALSAGLLAAEPLPNSQPQGTLASGGAHE
jgi:5-methylcytosine-specific restriction protein A